MIVEGFRSKMKPKKCISNYPVNWITIQKSPFEEMGQLELCKNYLTDQAHLLPSFYILLSFYEIF